MTKPVSIQQRIRILDAQGVSWREIARRLGVSRDTVRKYATMEDCSPKPAVRKGRRSLIDAHSETVDSWLAADRLMPPQAVPHWIGYNVLDSPMRDE